MALPPSFDVILEIPELDGFELRPSTSVELTLLDTPTPRLLLGGAVVLHGQHQDVIGSVLVASLAPPGAAAAVAARALTSKRVVFTVVSGSLADVVVQPK